MFADMLVMRNIIVVTSEPSANYHLKYFTEGDAKHLLHLVPSVGEVKQSSLVPISSHIDDVKKADLLVVAGGSVSEWCEHVASIADNSLVPVVFSELAYVKTEPEEFPYPNFVAASSVSKYGEFKLGSYLKDDGLNVTVTGHPMFDVLPEWKPVDGKVLVVSSVFKKDAGVELKNSVRVLEESGYDVVVRPHPKEHDDVWRGFKVSHVDSLLDDVASASFVVGVPGTAFSAALALNVPAVAVDGSTMDDTLPEYRQVFPYVDSSSIVDAVKHPQVVSDEVKDFIVGPVGGSGVRLMEFWKSFV